MSDVPGRSRSGVRIAGDQYQHLVALNQVLNALRPGSDVVTVTVEAPDAGNVDDVVVRRRNGHHQYTQVKHAVDGTSPVGTTWLIERPNPKSRSLLEKFHDSWTALAQQQGNQPTLVLVTDREIDPNDPLMRLLDRRTELLVPDIGRAAARDGRKAWVEHLGIDEDQLIEFLSTLRFQTGRPISAELERAEVLMAVLGLNDGQGAVDSALALIQDWVMERSSREVDVDELHERVLERVGVRTEPGALVVIEGIDDDPHTEDGDASVRFVERYDGDSANTRRRLSDPTEWSAVAAELNDASDAIRDAGHRRVVVRGAMRLPVWFAAGAAFRHVRGFEVAAQQGTQMWSSEDLTGSRPGLHVTVADIGQGPDLAVAVGVTTDPTTAVQRFIAEQQLPVGRLVSLLPAGGPSPAAIPDGPSAAALAVTALHEVRSLLESCPAERIRLYLATPGVFALLLGHRWNALRPTVVYEHLGAGLGYEETIRVDS